MINKLLELKLTAFRAFRTEVVIPLDAEVVLFYSSNGTGKTSTLAGLEFGLTGKVHDLSCYRDDYPRCLQYLNASNMAEASVKFCDDNGSEQIVTHTLEATGAVRKSLHSLTADQRNFYRDRCYLSQSSLGRLLESYQACDSDTPEQPLVRFVRELLGLDLLENLTTGLFEAGDIRRIEKTVPVLQRARDEIRRHDEALAMLNNQLVEAKAAWQLSLARTQQILGTTGDPMPGAAWDHFGITDRLQVIEEDSDAQAISAKFERAQVISGRVLRASSFLANDSTQLQHTTTKEQLDESVRAQTEVGNTLTALLGQIHGLCEQLGQPRVTSVNLATDLQYASEVIRNANTDMNRLLHRRVELGEQIRILILRDSESTTELGSTIYKQDQAIADKQRLGELLIALLSYINNEECPVCGRDYKELHTGSLATRIAEESAKLRDDVLQLEQHEIVRTRLNIEKGNIKRELTTLTQQLCSDRAVIASVLAAPRCAYATIPSL